MESEQRSESAGKWKAKEGEGRSIECHLLLLG